MAVLQVLRGTTPGQVFGLGGDRMVIGRHPECDIVVDAGAISRQHAVVLRMNNDFYLEDLKSRNGTYVNGELLRDRHKLVDNDRVKICDVLFAFHMAAPPAQAFRQMPDDDASRAEIVDDLGENPTATIMSSLDVQSSRSGLQIAVNPEVKLRALLEITRNLATATEVGRVLNNVLDSLFKIFIQADRGFIVMKDATTGALIPKAVRYRRGDDDESIRVSRTIIDKVMSTKEAILSADAAGDSRFNGSESIADFRIRSMMCAPLVDSTGTALGVLQIDTLDQRSRFQTADLDVLATVALQAAFAVESAQLHEADVQRRALERDLDLAHEVQKGFLPDGAPELPGYEFFDFYHAAHQIGGDYFDYVPLAEGKLAVVLGDVAGHGMAAALLMAKLAADVRYHLAGTTNAADAVNRLNAGFSRGDWADRFVTLVAIVLDPAKHEATIVNAGHMAPYRRKADGEVDQLGEEQKGFPLGVDGDACYEAATVTLGPGEVLTIYTDGITEAMNAEDKLYGDDRLVQQIRTIADGGAAGLGNAILDDVGRYCGTRPQSDDRCLICFGRKK